MRTRTLIVVVLGIPFLLFSNWVALTEGYLAIFAVAGANAPSAQVFGDLFISLSLLLTFIAKDCRERGAVFWPWVPATLALGSIAPMGYFAWRALSERKAPVPA